MRDALLDVTGRVAATCAAFALVVMAVFWPDSRLLIGGLVVNVAVFVGGWALRGWSDREEMRGERERRDSAVTAAGEMAQAAQSLPRRGIPQTDDGETPLFSELITDSREEADA